MSTEEILAELPKLSLDEVEVIFQRAESLLHDEASPELLSAIEEADQQSEGGDLTVEQMQDQVRQWSHTK
ncbi:MAG: hypothetical protein KTR33_03355 [Gammaproteobacteria bacterium]|nr:hypothetical protein [Gammaproteobacteria bacterium]